MKPGLSSFNTINNNKNSESLGQLINAKGNLNNIEGDFFSLGSQTNSLDGFLSDMSNFVDYQRKVPLDDINLLLRNKSNKLDFSNVSLGSFRSIQQSTDNDNSNISTKDILNTDSENKKDSLIDCISSNKAENTNEKLLPITKKIQNIIIKNNNEKLNNVTIKSKSTKNVELASTQENQGVVTKMRNQVEIENLKQKKKRENDGQTKTQTIDNSYKKNEIIQQQQQQIMIQNKQRNLNSSQNDQIEKENFNQQPKFVINSSSPPKDRQDQTIQKQTSIQPQSYIQDRENGYEYSYQKNSPQIQTDQIEKEIFNQQPKIVNSNSPPSKDRQDQIIQRQPNLQPQSYIQDRENGYEYSYQKNSPQIQNDQIEKENFNQQLKFVNNNNSPPSKDRQDQIIQRQPNLLQQSYIQERENGYEYSYQKNSPQIQQNSQQVRFMPNQNANFESPQSLYENRSRQRMNDQTQFYQQQNSSLNYSNRYTKQTQKSGYSNQIQSQKMNFDEFQQIPYNTPTKSNYQSTQNSYSSPQKVNFDDAYQVQQSSFNDSMQAQKNPFSAPRTRSNYDESIQKQFFDDSIQMQQMQLGSSYSEASYDDSFQDQQFSPYPPSQRPIYDDSIQSSYSAPAPKINVNEIIQTPKISYTNNRSRSNYGENFHMQPLSYQRSNFEDPIQKMNSNFDDDTYSPSQMKSFDESINESIQFEQQNSNFYEFQQSQQATPIGLKTKISFEESIQSQLEAENRLHQMIKEKVLSKAIYEPPLFVSAMSSDDLFLNPFLLQFEPESYWANYNQKICFRNIVNSFFRVNNTRITKFIYKLYNMLQITSKDPFYKSIIGVNWITNQIFTVNVHYFAAMLNLSSSAVNSIVYNEIDNIFSIYNFVEITPNNFMNAGLSEFLTTPDPAIKLMFHCTNKFVNKKLSQIELDEIENKCRNIYSVHKSNTIARPKYPAFSK